MDVLEGKKKAYFVDDAGTARAELPIAIWKGRKSSPMMKRKIEGSEARQGGLSLAQEVFLGSLHDADSVYENLRSVHGRV